MQWQGIVEFISVAETQSFTLTAQKLDISVAQVSRQVSALEQRLAARLLHRTTRKVSLTEQGQLYYQYCRPLLDGLHEAELALLQTQDKPVGKLRITAPVYYGETVVAPILHQYLIDFPQLNAELLLDNRKADLVADHIDLAIRLGPMDESSLMVTQLGSRIHHVCASQQCLIGAMNMWRFKEGTQHREISVNGRLRCNSGGSLVQAALKGLGLVQLPDYYVDTYLQSSQLISVLEPFALTDGIWAIAPRSRFIPPKVSRFIEYLKAALLAE
jgi:DNA-binding transcriptional LysR family regulator